MKSVIYELLKWGCLALLLWGILLNISRSQLEDRVFNLERKVNSLETDLFENQRKVRHLMIKNGLTAETKIMEDLK